MKILLLMETQPPPEAIRCSWVYKNVYRGVVDDLLGTYIGPDIIQPLQISIALPPPCNRAMRMYSIRDIKAKRIQDIICCQKCRPLDYGFRSKNLMVADLGNSYVENEWYWDITL